MLVFPDQAGIKVLFMVFYVGFFVNYISVIKLAQIAHLILGQPKNTSIEQSERKI